MTEDSYGILITSLLCDVLVFVFLFMIFKKVSMSGVRKEIARLEKQQQRAYERELIEKKEKHARITNSYKNAPNVSVNCSHLNGSTTRIPYKAKLYASRIYLVGNWIETNSESGGGEYYPEGSTWPDYAPPYTKTTYAFQTKARVRVSICEGCFRESYQSQRAARSPNIFQTISKIKFVPGCYILMIIVVCSMSRT